MYQKIEFYDLPYKLEQIEYATDFYEIRYGSNKITNQRCLIKIFMFKNEEKFSKKYQKVSKELSLH